jgi:8-oxo-dGTP diphosphatase
MLLGFWLTAFVKTVSWRMVMISKTAAATSSTSGHYSGLVTRCDVLLLSILLNVGLTLVIFLLLFLSSDEHHSDYLVASRAMQLRHQQELALNTHAEVLGDVPSLQQPLFSTALQFNGGHPWATQKGSCYCNDQPYCLCTPSLAIDLVIVSGTDHVLLVRRKDTSQLATMGGFVQVGETTEQAVRRELQEETGIRLDSLDKENPGQLELVGVYSDPSRDNRRHTVSAVYAVHVSEKLQPVAADDVKQVVRIPLKDIEKYEFFADHKSILLDYRRIHQQKKTDVLNLPPLATNQGDYAPHVRRAVCGYQPWEQV